MTQDLPIKVHYYVEVVRAKKFEQVEKISLLHIIILR